MDSSTLRNLVSNIRFADGRSQILVNLRQILDYCKSVGDLPLDSSYNLLVTTLLNRVNQSFIGHLTEKERIQLFDSIFLEGPIVDTYLCLHHALTISKDAYFTEKLVQLVYSFIKNRFDQLLICMTKTKVCFDEDLLCQSLSNIVDICAKKVISPTGLQAHIYSKYITLSILQALSKVHEGVLQGRSGRISLISKLLVKLCVHGLGDVCLNILVPWINRKIEGEIDTLVWTRIGGKLLEEGACFNGFEMLVTDWLLKCNSHSIPLLFGDLVLTNSCIKHVITRKLIFNKTFPVQDRVPEKVAIYLGSSASRRILLCQTFQELLLVWSDPGAVKHSSIHQRLYISRSLLCFAQAMQICERKSVVSKCIQRIMNGIQLHITSGCSTTNIMGQIVGQELTLLFQPHISEPLNFGLDISDPSVSEISKQLLDPVSEDIVSQLQLLDLNEEIVDNDIRNCVATDVDSDDDLVAYDIPVNENIKKFGVEYEDNVEKPIPAPVYLRDCFENLVEKKCRRKFEANFYALPSLVKVNALGLFDIVESLTLRLLNLENHFFVDEFEKIRLQSMTLCCSLAPSKICPILARQLFARNYSISQRMLILDVLVSSAEQLHTTYIEDVGDIKTPQNSKENDLKDWEKIIELKVANQTKYYSKGEKIITLAKLNKFSPVAHYFFYPLLSSFQLEKCSSLDLLDSDFIVLSRILYALAYFVKCAQNSSHILKIVQLLLETVWSLRYHEESVVRQAVLTAFKACIIALPKGCVTIVFEILSDGFDWLKEVSEHDVDERCKTEATNCIILMHKCVQDSNDDN